jgi:hypothetical protein
MNENAVPYHQLATVVLRQKLVKNEALWRRYTHPGNAPTSGLASLYAAKCQAIVDELNRRAAAGEQDNL